MMRVGEVLVTVVLGLLVLPISGIAGESEAVTQQRQAGSRTDAKSLSQGERVKKADEKGVQTRGLFSKKKKKKPVGGAAGHTESTEQVDPVAGFSRDTHR